MLINTYIVVATGFHPGNRGSIPLGGRHIPSPALAGLFYFCCPAAAAGRLSHVLLSIERSRHTSGAPEVARGMTESNRS